MLLLIFLLTTVLALPAPTITKAPSIAKRADSSIDLGTWTTSIKSVTTKDPVTSASDVFSTMADKLWDQYWYDDNSNFRDSCSNNKTPVLWPVAVAGKAVIDQGDTSKIADVVSALGKYKSTTNDGGYSASTAKDDDIYIDDDSQASWVFIDAYSKVPNLDYYDDANDLYAFIKSYNDSKVGGVIWDINGDYVASISTLEAGLAAAKLYSAELKESLLEFSAYCVTWTLTKLLDDDDKFIYDGMSESGTINDGKLTYTIGVAISTLSLLDKHNYGSEDWKAMAVELAVRFMAGGQLNSQFYTDDYINDQIRYSHLLFAGFADLLENTSPSGSYQTSVYTAVKNELVREARYLYDTYDTSTINADGCSSENEDLLDFASLAQIFYEVLRVADGI